MDHPSSSSSPGTCLSPPSWQKLFPFQNRSNAIFYEPRYICSIILLIKRSLTVRRGCGYADGGQDREDLESVEDGRQRGVSGGVERDVVLAELVVGVRVVGRVGVEVLWGEAPWIPKLAVDCDVELPYGVTGEEL
jgi:hypothetical protein